MSLRAAMLSLAAACAHVAIACDVTGDLRLPDRGSPALQSGADAGGVRIVGSDGSTAATDGGTGDEAGDGALPVDADVEDALALCPINPCTGTDVCCYVAKSATSGAYRCMTACPNGAAPVACAGPQQCGGASPYCCASVALGPGAVPNCPIDGMSSACVGACSTDLGLGCGLTDTFRLCHASADCASDSNSPFCCTYPGSGVSSLVCVSGLVKSTLGLSCSP